MRNRLCPALRSDAVFYSNRSAALASLQKWEEALEDAEQVRVS